MSNASDNNKEYFCTAAKSITKLEKKNKKLKENVLEERSVHVSSNLIVINTLRMWRLTNELICKTLQEGVFNGDLKETAAKAFASAHTSPDKSVDMLLRVLNSSPHVNCGQTRDANTIFTVLRNNPPAQKLAF